MTSPLRNGDEPVVRLVSDTTVVVDASTSLRDAAEQFSKAEVGMLVVGDLTSVEGVISERDIVRAVALGADLDATRVASVESEHLVWATTNSTIADVAEEMMEHYIRHVLVRDETGGCAGVVSMRDLLGAYLD